MIGLQLDVSQRIVIACALVGMALMFLIVPYQSVYRPGDSRQVSGSAGYHFIFAMPDAVDCIETVGRSVRQPGAVSLRGGCRNYLDVGRLVLSLLAFVCGSLTILLLMSLKKRRSFKSNKSAQFRYGQAGPPNDPRPIPSTPSPVI